MDYSARVVSRQHKRVLQDLVLSRKEPEPSEYERIYQILINDEGPIIALLERSPQNHHFRSAFVASPDEMLPRLSHFLQCIRLSLLPQNTQFTNSVGGIGSATANNLIRIPAAFTNHLILVLADEPAAIFDIGSSGYHNFILCVLDLYISLAGIATVSLVTLRELLSKILDMPHRVRIIEKIVSETTGATLFTELFAKDSLIRQVFKDDSLRRFGSRLAKLVIDCIVSHGLDIDDIVLVWEKMEALYMKIEAQVKSIELGVGAVAVGRMPIHLDEDEQELLKSALIAIPYNITTAGHTIRSIIGRYRGHIRLILSSFPCSTCKAQLAGIIKADSENIQSPEFQRGFVDIKAPLGVFPIYLSDAAMRDLKNSRVEGTLSKILAILQKLADGMWDSDPELSVSKDKSRAGSEPVLRAARWRVDGYIIWERGVGRAEENSEEWIQIVKIIRIGSESDMKKVVSDARKAQRTYTKEYRKAAAINITNPARLGGLMPQKFSGENAIGLESNNAVVFGSSSSKALAPGDALILHKIFCTGKQYCLTKRVAEMILEGGQQVEVPFVVSPEEESIINYFNSSVCILGRSGTGKTTCLVFRLLAAYLRDRMMNDGKEVRQIFLTRSPVLAGKIRQYVNRLIDSQCMRFTIQSDTTEASSIHRIVDEDEISTTGLIDIDSKEWPMVCTYDAFATMLERSLKFTQRNIFSSASEESQLEVANRRVDFGKFKRSYWPSFPSSARKGLSADGVFSEIIGVIKANSSRSNYLPLSKEEYQALSRRSAPNFHQGREREAVYTVYEIYERRKTSFGEWDDLDRTSKIQKLLAQDEKLSSRIRSQITEVFVDEIQDQRLAEIELLLDLVNDTKAFAFAGDTAQCISRDSCFRFQDLQDAFYRKYKHHGDLSNQKNLAKLDRFTLSKNYRTHNGILKLAAKVVDSLSTAFPYAIDKFSPELGDFNGPVPIIFSGFTSEIFTPREGETNTTISEFGAEQVLIVRDDDAKNLLVESMGDKVLILTILESKGMEFQDVFLFNFFSGSLCTTAFRALANSQMTGAPLDDLKYPELCIELKNLYVAITRSREMLYIIENDATVVLPLQEMWGLGSGDPIIDVVTPDDPTIQTRLDEIRQGQSQPHEWKDKGDEFFNQRMYEQAIYCYKRAGSVIFADMCRASIEERNGRDIMFDPDSFKAAREHYLEAARLFRKCDRYDKALKCYESIKEYQLAGELCEELSKIPAHASHNYRLRAATYFMQADLVLRATEIYVDLGVHELVVKGYRKLDLIKDLIQYLKKNQKEIDPKLYHQNSRIIALSIFSSENTDDLRKAAISLLSDNEQEQLYKKFKFYGELSKLLISQGRLEEAIELAFVEGKWKEVGDLLKLIASTPLRGSEFFVTNGERYAERILFYELSTSLQDSRELEPFKKKLASESLAPCGQALQLFRDVSHILSQDLFDTSASFPEGPLIDTSQDARILVELMILKMFAVEEKKAPSHSSSNLYNGVLIVETIRQCAYNLLEMHRSRTLVYNAILTLFFEVVPEQNSNGYKVARSSPIYDGDGYWTQNVTGDELVERILRVLREWTIKAYQKCVLQREQEYFRGSPCQHFVIRRYCNREDCPHGIHKTVIRQTEMTEHLNLSWSMAVLTSYYEYVYRNGVLGRDPDESQWNLIKKQGHLWWKRVFENVTVTSDLLQSPSARLYLAEIKSNAIRCKVSNNPDKDIQREARATLGCLDKFEWRLKAMIRNMSLPGAEKIDFWSLINCWERMVSSDLRRSLEKDLWWRYLSGIEPIGRSTMQLLYGLENCLWDQSKAISTMTAFASHFKRNLSNLTEYKDVHPLLNRLDRVMAIVLYLASSNNFVLKKSQLEYLQNHPALNSGRNREYNSNIFASANNILHNIVDVYNTIADKVRSSQKPLWYKEAMCRRVEESSVIAMLNSKTPTAMLGASEFIRKFYTQAGKESFWVMRRGQPYARALALDAVKNKPKSDHQFLDWILENIDIIQGLVDPIIYSHQSEKTQQPKRLSSLPTIPFQVSNRNYVQTGPASQTEGTTDRQVIDDLNSIEEADTTAYEKSQHVSAARLIQRNWRISSIAIRNARYVEQNPTHRRITKIFESPNFPLDAKSTLSQKCFRMVAFILFDLITKSRSQLRVITANLENVSRRKSSMEVMEKVLGGHELVNGYDEQLAAIETSIEPSALGSGSHTTSIVMQVVEIIHKTEGLGKTISAAQSDLNRWICELK